MPKKSKERLYAESIHDQSKEILIDQWRVLLQEDPEYFKQIHQILRQDNTVAEALIHRMPAPRRKHLMYWLIPLARVGMQQVTFDMEDKYSYSGRGEEGVQDEA